MNQRRTNAGPARQVELNSEGRAIPRAQLAGVIASNLLKASAETLINLHEEGMAHRDVKPENFLYDQVGKFFLSDFGLATDAYHHSYRGTPDFMPFEMHIRDESKRPQISAKAGDIWATGISAMEILLGTTPAKVAKVASNHFSREPKYQAILIEHYQAYKALHEAANSITHRDKKLAFFAKQQGITAPYAKMFSDLLEFYPNHYEVVTKSLAPLPKDRPTALTLRELAYDEYFEYEQVDLSLLLKSSEFNQTNVDDTKLTEARVALTEAVDQKKYERKFENWIDDIRDDKPAVHLSVLEHNTKAYFEPGPFAKADQKPKLPSIAEDETTGAEGAK